MGFDDEWFKETGVKFERADDFVEILKTKGLPEDRKPFAKKRHYPTDSGSCLRKRLLKMYAAPTSNRPTLTDHLTWKIGGSLGEFLAEAGIRAGLTADIDMTAEEKTLFRVAPCQLEYSGRIDLPINDPLFDSVIELWMGPDNQVIPVEYKTIKQKGFDTEESQSGYLRLGVVDMPKKDHVMQVHHYMKFLGAPYGYVVYMNKNDQRVIAHRVYWNDNVWQCVMDEALVAEAYYFAGIVPTREACGHRGQIAFYQKTMYDTISVPEDPVETIVRTYTHEGGKKLTRGQVEEALNDPTHTWHAHLKGLVEEYTKNPEFKEERVKVAEPGDINRNGLKFPCGYKGQDGGEGGNCELMHLCWRDQIMQFGSAKEKAICEETAWYQFKEGVLDLNIEELRKNGAPNPALAVNEAPKAQT